MIKFIKRIISNELFLYIAVGGATTLINFIIYVIFTDLLRTNFAENSYRVAYVIAFVIAVLFAFFADKFIVFKSELNIGNLARELSQFISARIFSSIVGFFLTIGTVELLKDQGMIDVFATKIGIIPSFIFNILFNYIISKFFIFKNN